MKVSNRQLLLFYLTTVCLLTIYTLTSLKECEAYWMHDASLTITKWKLLANTSLFFLLPVLIILAQLHFKITIPTKFFLTQFFISLTSILLLLFAINKPCENKNGHYMFISPTLTIGYYLFKLVSLVIICVIIIQTIILKNKIAKTEQVQ
jgi:hypothetical protein